MIVTPFRTWADLNRYLRTLPFRPEVRLVQDVAYSKDLDQRPSVSELEPLLQALGNPRDWGVMEGARLSRRVQLLRAMKAGIEEPETSEIRRLLILGEACGLYRRADSNLQSPQVRWRCRRTPGCVSHNHEHSSTFRGADSATCKLYSVQLFAHIFECAGHWAMLHNPSWSEALDLLGDIHARLTDGAILLPPGNVGYAP